MNIEYDPIKNAKNIRERGICFSFVESFDFQSAIYEIDNRKNYGETRIKAIGFLNNRLMVLIFKNTISGIRVISFRKANKREVNKYVRTN